jgi:hypothetical protein
MLWKTINTQQNCVSYPNEYLHVLSELLVLECRKFKTCSWTYENRVNCARYVNTLRQFFASWGSSVRIVSDYSLDDGFDPWWRQRMFPVVSVSRPAQKVQTSENAKLTIQRGTVKFPILIFRWWPTSNNKKYEHGGRLTFEIHVFGGYNSRTVAPRQMKFGTMMNTYKSCESLFSFA